MISISRRISTIFTSRDIFDSLAAFHSLHARVGSFKSYNEIPRKSCLLPAFLRLIHAGGPGYLHEHCDRLHRELGPIFRERLGQVEMVFVADTKMIQTVVANEGPRPRHNVPPAWLLYNKIKGIERGLFFQTGESWHKLRQAFSKVMLADASKVHKFTQDNHAINSDLLASWHATNRVETNQSPLIVIDDIKSELCKWSIETTGFMLFGNRMGCIPVDGSDTTRAKQLVASVANMFTETSNFQILPCTVAQRLNMPSWRRFEAASDQMLVLATDLTKEFIREAKQTGASDSLVKDLINLDELTNNEILRTLVDLIIAAADTTSNSLQWMLYSLGRYPAAQQKIYDELKTIEGNSEAFHDLRRSAPHLIAFVKEVSRLYPNAPFLARTLDREVVLGDYIVPAGVPIVFSLYTTGRLDRYFEEPHVFAPERWLRNQRSCRMAKTHAYASLPFGVGARMCIGRRLADMEMHLFVSSVVLRYRVETIAEDVNIKLKMILGPEKPISLRVTPRIP